MYLEIRRSLRIHNSWRYPSTPCRVSVSFDEQATYYNLPNVEEKREWKLSGRQLRILHLDSVASAKCSFMLGVFRVKETKIITRISGISDHIPIIFYKYIFVFRFSSTKETRRNREERRGKILSSNGNRLISIVSLMQKSGMSKRSLEVCESCVCYLFV